MGMQTLSSPQLCAPSAGGGVSVTPSGTSWANSSWVEIIASTASAIVLTGLDVISVGAAVPFEVDIGVGSAGAESVVTTFRGEYADNTFRGQGYIPHVIPLDNIGSGQRVAIRMRKNSTSTTAWTFAITYVAKPFTGTMLTTASPQLSFPAAANGVTLAVNTVTPWANPAYTEVISSTSSAIVLVGIVAVGWASGSEWEIDLATGGSGSETVITTVRHGAGGPADGPFFMPFRNPLDNIASATRVAARARRTNTGFGGPALALVYHAKPL